MKIEFYSLAFAILLGFIHITAASFSVKAVFGHSYSIGPRDDHRQPPGIAGRLERASRNFQETFLLFAASVLIVANSGSSGVLSQFGSILYLGGRLVYFPLYSIGASWPRSLCWKFATLGIFLIVLQYLLTEFGQIKV